jgi:large subunit ribosomal protein L6
VSRIGKKPVAIPKGVKVAVQAEQVSVEGPKGKLVRAITPGITVKVEEDKVLVTRGGNDRFQRAKHGLVRALIANMIKGAHQGFERSLEISGVGYRVEAAGRKLTFLLGFSHKVEMTIPEKLEVAIDKQTKLTIRGIDCETVGQFAATIRALKDPDPYKAKGIIYEGEKILRKAGKKAIS